VNLQNAELDKLFLKWRKFFKKCLQKRRRKLNISWKPLRISVFLLVLFIAKSGFLQANEIKLGLHGGLSIPNIKGNTEQSKGFSSRLGPNFGLFGELIMSNHFSLVMEVNYASQGGKRNGLQPITNLPSDLQLPLGMTLYANFHNETILDYIEIPVVARLGYGRQLRVFVNAGPYIGFLVRAKTITSGTSTVYLDPAGTQLFLLPPDYQPLMLSFDATTSVREDVRSTNLGIVGGGGLLYPLGSGSVILEAHFSLGLSNVQRNVETGGKNHTGAVVITVGYALPI
jgi:hypothetical protein